MAQPIEYTNAYYDELRSLIPSPEVLVKNGYRLAQFSDQELQLKKRCSRCLKIVRSNKPQTQFVPPPHGRSLTAAIPGTRNMTVKPAFGGSPLMTSPDKADVEPPAKALCFFHIGVFQFGKWSCCNNHRSSAGCMKDSKHTPYHYKDGELRRNWTLYRTDDASQHSDHRPAVAIDCEMGTSITGESELIRVTLLDYFSTEVLVDALVAPDAQMLHYNTRFSGITKRDMDTARRQKRCLFGRKAARAACMQFVGPHTVIVAHSGHNDLLSLRWIHTDIVDTYIIEAARIRETEGQALAESAIEDELLSQAEAAQIDTEVALVPAVEGTTSMAIQEQTSAAQGGPSKPKKRQKGTGPLALKTLARERLGFEIQSKGRLGHDSWEDAMAARDLVNWYVQQLGLVQTVAI